MQNWYPIGDERIRRESWSVSQLKCSEGDIKAIAPLGTLIAIVSNTSNTHSVGDKDAKSVLRIYSGSCNLVTSVKWYIRVEHILALQWTENLELVAVSANGSVRVYSAHGEHLRTFELHLYGLSGNSQIDPKHIKLRCWGDGIVYLNITSQLLYIQRGFDSTSYRPISLPDFALTITAIGIVPNKNWNDVIIIFSTENGTSYVRMEHIMKCTDYDTLSFYLHKINPCSYTDIVSCSYYSVDGNCYVALGNRDNGVIASLSYCDTRFTILWEITTGTYVDLGILSKGILVTVTSSGIKFILDAVYELTFNVRALCISNEIGGGIRLFSQNSIEFYAVVSDESKHLFLTEKYHPAASLIKAFDLFKKGDPLSYESLYSIKDFDGAYGVCVKAAQDEWDFDLCIRIIECGLFAKSLSSTFTRNKVIHKNLPVEDDIKTQNDISHQYEINSNTLINHLLVIAYLRIANAIKEKPSYIKTNVYQLASLGIERMIIILTSLKCYFLGIRISKFLNINYNSILLEWVRMRVKLGSHLTDNELYDIIIKRLEDYAGIVLSFSDIAEVVSREGREALALSILDKEKSSINQFRVLCKWNQLSRAAAVALNEGNPLLMNYIILEAQKNHNLLNIIALSKEYTLLRNLFIKQSLSSEDNSQIQPFYEHTNDTFNAGLRASIQAIGKFHNKSYAFGTDRLTMGDKDKMRVEDYKEWLSYANGFFGSSINEEADTQSAIEDSAFWHESINNKITLLNLQMEFQSNNESLGSVVGLSLIETLFKLYKVGLFKEAQLLVNTFKVPPNQIHCCKLVALYNSHNINELISMVQDKSLISHFVFVKNSRPFADLIIESLISLGASSFLDPVINNLKPQQQTYWINRINKRGKPDFKEENVNLLKSFGIKFWQ
ncbi:conserved hypothetical protein [Theileria equi strain WA]|uniref:Vacuolar protein sorting-associated protein 16 homolog n=1 Tax=Theileria equi strain WA TaxID=1537102 RepID=L1LGB2_THEEQ|nr:conserved hypothetical protein [Theileria equi strain WA]EKX74304.1 conserved hypothetical protein [Theileria equi strain WA]|eukprot:XP_004833756.1 conserved hypothetical protein [Theileria equi strain WA]